MPDKPSGRIFISYSRKDGAAFAHDLRSRLISNRFSIWQDIVTLEGGRDWWSQIEDALKSKELQHFVFVVTPAALASPVVRREIRLARQEGKTVCPIKGPELSDLAQLPRWLGQVFDLDLPEHCATLTRVLQDQSRQKRVAMMAPEPPPDFVRRPTEFNALKRQLLDTKGDAVAITAALRGAGGYGKTTLAKSLAHDPDIQDAYFDGILWVELGERPDNLLSIISDLIEIVSGERPGLQHINSASARLSEALGDRRVLLVVDDVWREQDLRPFTQGGARTTRLITTRNDHVLPSSVIRQALGAMGEAEALALLVSGLPAEKIQSSRPELTALGGRLRRWRSSAVYALCVLPDGRLASCGLDKSIRLWDLHLADDRKKRAIGRLWRAEIAQPGVWLAGKAFQQCRSKSRFSDARLAREEHHLPFPVHRPRPAAQQQFEFFFAPDQPGEDTSTSERN
jgi:hypothetical protein